MRFPQRWSLRALIITPLAAAGCAGDGPTGYDFDPPHTLRRRWCDCNTLGEPAAFWDVIERKPYDRDRVEYYRWLHGEGPGDAAWVVPAGAPLPSPPPVAVDAPAPPLAGAPPAVPPAG